MLSLQVRIYTVLSCFLVGIPIVGVEGLLLDVQWSNVRALVFPQCAKDLFIKPRELFFFLKCFSL